MIYNAILVRYTGEFGVKSARSQQSICDLLHGNIRRGLQESGNEGIVDRLQLLPRRGRLYIDVGGNREEDMATLVSVLSRTFGVSSISPCFHTPIRDSSAVVSTAAKLMVAHGIDPGSSLASIRAVDNTSVDVPRLRERVDAFARQLTGRHANGKQRFSRRRFRPVRKWDTGPWDAGLEHTLEIEVYADHAFISVERIRAPGGFPLGLEARLVALVSGGLDSPVAAWFAMRRGALPVFVVMDTHAPGAGEAATSVVRERALANVRTLLRYAEGAAERPAVYVVDNSVALDDFMAQGGKKGLTCLLCKRLMYRVAAHVCELHRAQGIVTGEILGEQASQTARNLRTLDCAVPIPVHRPLLGFDKEEVVAWAARIGTESVARMPSEPCRGVPSHPVLNARLPEVEETEARMDIEGYVAECVAGIEGQAVAP